MRTSNSQKYSRMRNSTMKSSSPKYKMLNSTSGGAHRDSKMYIKAMEEELQRSKMAVESISSFKSTEQHLKKKIDETQIEVQSCMLKITIQCKKQKALTDLIAMLKGQMFTFQTKHKKEQQKISNNHEKMVKKIEYDVQQILQKHNQQIAKINLLKEYANGRRSERVVYSNLFKKLEREIKHYEEIYKEELLKTEAIMLKKSKQSSSLQTNINFTLFPNLNTSNTSNTNSLSTSEKDTKYLLEVSKTNYQTERFHPLMASTRNQNNLFITSCNGPKDTFHRKSFSRIMAESARQSAKNECVKTPKVIKAQIVEYERQIEKLQIYGGCQSVSQLLEHYSTLQDQNEQLLGSIQILNDQIAFYQDTNNTLSRQTKDRLFAAKALRNSIFISLGEAFLEYQADKPQQLHQAKYLSQFCSVFGLSQDNEKITDDILEKLDWRIDCVVQQQKPSLQVLPSRQETIFSEMVVESLLDRMDKFHDCEKILDIGSFQNEYLKELNKGKKTHKVKKI